VVAFLIALGLALPSHAADWQVRNATADGTRFELDVELPPPVRAERDVDGRPFTELRFPGFAPDGAPGTPELYVATRLVAVPPGGSARVQVLQSDIQDLGTTWIVPRASAYVEAVPVGRAGGVGGETAEFMRSEVTYDARAYAARGAVVEPAHIGPAGVLRHQSVVELQIRPLLFDPHSGRARLVRRLRLAIEISAPARGIAAAAPEITPPAWQRLYGGALLNAASSAAWRSAPARTPHATKALASGLLRPGLLGEEEWKVRVTATGPQRVTAATLAAAGFPPSAPVGQLRLVLRRFDPAQPLTPSILEIPIQIVDTDGDGAFETGDSFLFYGEHPRDDTTSEDPLPRSTQANVYWLSLATSGTPARMAVRPPRPTAPAGPTTFAQDLATEQDLVMNAYVFGSNDDPGDVQEMYFWTMAARVRDFGGNLQIPVGRVTVPLPGRAPSSDVEVCVETQEENLNAPFFLYAQSAGRDSVLVGSNPGTFPTPSLPPVRQSTCGTAPAAALTGTDLRVFIRPQLPDVDFGIPYLDRVRLRYTSTYTALNNGVRCTSGGASGATRFAIGGFTAPTVRAFDITNPKTPAAFDLTGQLSGGTLQLADSIPAGVTRTYVVVSDASIPLASVSVDRPERDDLRLLDELDTAPQGAYDCLVVVADELADEPMLQQWKAFREAQGHRLRLVRTSDVYDAFRGGLPHYEAIHRASQLAFQNWGIGFIALVGDGSEDAAHVLTGSGPNLVPTRVRYFHVAGSSDGIGAYRNDANDKYYTQVAGPPGDFAPDLLVGRIPAGSTTELRAVLAKTMHYETHEPGDDGAWRKRVVMYADDEWVKRSVGFNPLAHRRGCGERGFETGILQASLFVDGAFPGDLRASRFLLREHSDRLGRGDRAPLVPEHRATMPDSHFVQCGGDGLAHATSFAEAQFYLGLVEGQVGDALMDSVGAGCLFLAVQSHANRFIVGDEGVMQPSVEPPFFTPPFENPGKPFVFFGFGCHLNEFGDSGEESSGGPREALGELFVLAESRGAVASYASTGYEYLDLNNAFNNLMWEAIFQKRYQRGIGGGQVDADTIAADWGLNELVTISEINFGGVNPRDRRAEVIARHILLGDPMLQLDGGSPRIPRPTPDEITNGILYPDNRLAVIDRNQPLGLTFTVRDEQGIDSLWVVRRFPGGGVQPIENVTITALADTVPEIRAKRAYRVQFQFMVDECNFDVVFGARDLAGRVTEFVGRLFFEQRLLANGVAIQSGERVDPRTAFVLEIGGCTPIPSLPLEAYLDGVRVPEGMGEGELVIDSDKEMVNWTAAFTPTLSSGTHSLRFVYAGADLATYDVQVGGFGVSEILAFPNPLTDRHAVMRLYFHLGEPIAGGYLRVMDVNGRTVLRRDLADPGVVQSDLAVPPGQIGSGVGQDDTHWNYVELFRDGLDAHGDALANGVYIYELQIRGLSGEAARKRDRVVLMR
jgi:hypothetical protein